MSFKKWVPLERLNASDLNTHLVDQSIPRFADAAARDIAIPAPTNGQMCWLDSTSLLLVRRGGAWVEVNNGNPRMWAADVNVATAVGSVTVSAIPSTLRTLRITFSARSTVNSVYSTIGLRINGSVFVGDYYWGTLFTQNLGAATALGSNGQQAYWGALYLAGATVGNPATTGQGEFVLEGWNSPHSGLGLSGVGGFFFSTTQNVYGTTAGYCYTAGPYVSVTLLETGGNNFAVGAQFTLRGYY